MVNSWRAKTTSWSFQYHLQDVEKDQALYWLEKYLVLSWEGSRGSIPWKTNRTKRCWNYSRDWTIKTPRPWGTVSSLRLPEDTLHEDRAGGKPTQTAQFLPQHALSTYWVLAQQQDEPVKDIWKDIEDDGRTPTWELGGATRLSPGGAASAPEGGPMAEVMTRYGEPRALRGAPTAPRVRGALTGVSV